MEDHLSSLVWIVSVAEENSHAERTCGRPYGVDMTGPKCVFICVYAKIHKGCVNTCKVGKSPKAAPIHRDCYHPEISLCIPFSIQNIP